MQCVNDGKPARYECTACGRLFCEECIKHVAFQRTTVELCPVCGNPVRQAGAKPLSEKSFWYYLFTAFYYPLTGKGPLVLLINWILVGFALALSYCAIVVGLTRIIGFLGLGLAYGYVYFLLFTVIRKTSMGEDEPPTTPDLENLVDVLPTLWKVIMLAAVWTGPAVILSHLADGTPQKVDQGVVLTLGGPITLWSYIIGPGHTDVVRFLAGLGAFLLPMSLLAVATFNSLRGLHPTPILITIMRVPGQYVVCCAVFYLVLLLREVLWVAVAAASSPLLGLCFRPLFLVYSLYLLGRMLGGLHAANSTRLGWVRT